MAENRVLFVNGLVFAGGGTATDPADQVVDCAGATVMPGLVDSHAHMTFSSAGRSHCKRVTSIGS